MKKNGFFRGIFGVTLILGLVFIGCDLGTNAAVTVTEEDDPATGIISATTASKIFDYEQVQGGIKINKFKSAAALGVYLASGAPAASINTRFNIARSAGPAGATLFISKIGDKNVVAIGAQAFTPVPGNADTDITTIVATIKLPPTITAIAADSFSGNFASIPVVEIPSEVYDILPDDVKAGLGNSIQLVQLVPVAGYSFPAREIYGKFPGTMTINQLHTALGMPPYASEKYGGIALYLNEKLTNEVQGSTGITKATLLYVNAADIEEGGTPGTVTYPELDTSNWPQDNNLNGGMYDGTFYFQESADGKALAYNPMGRGNGKDTYIPDIWLLQETGAGAFPAGTWINISNSNEKLIFTAAQVTIDSPYFDTVQLDYTISGNTFVCTNYQKIPYVPTAADQAEIAAFNEAAFRESHPWIPASSTITPTATKRGMEYIIEDNPTMTFENDPEALGTWITVEFIYIIDWFDPADIDEDFDGGWLESLAFAANGVLTCNGYTSPAYSWTKNLIKMEDGDGVTAPEYEIKTIAGTAYLFVQNKNGDYTYRARKPGWFVMRKQS